MNSRLRRQRTAAACGAAGATLGLAAGAIQASVGDRIPAWTAAKANPLGLGLLTILLSLIALAGAAVLRRPQNLSPGRRASATIGLLVPAALCLSTVGRLWYLPAVLLFTAAGFAIAAGGIRDFYAVIRANWLLGLVSVLGAFELLMAVTASPPTTLATGIVGGLALMAAPWLTGRSRAGALALLLLGTLPFAVLTWWSVATPLLAILALGIGLPAIRSHAAGAHRSRQLAAEPTPATLT